MHYMKSDMGGAAAVIGAVELAARLKLPIHLRAVVPSAENSVDALSVRPSDVINSWSGKTIEIIDTDAEGRLVLADGLAYLQATYQPETLLDLATLTGSSVRTLGYAAGALFTNEDELAHQLSEAGFRTHERLWRLPLWSDYEDMLHSDVADVRNFSGKPIAGAIAAAKFLEFFVKDQPRWAHMDIAGVAFGDSPYTKMKASTGYGVRLLVEFMKGL
jgi:leucyl aminopeptidase